MKFINLYIQTEYSMLNSLISINELVKLAKVSKIDAIGICDNQMHGAIKFYNACKAASIKPIIGLKLEVIIEGQKTAILVYAKSILGYQNLMKLSSIKEIKGQLDQNVLKKYSLDVLAILPSDENEVTLAIKQNKLSYATKAINLYKEIYHDLYMGVDVQTDEARIYIDNIIEFSKNNNVLAVAINKTNYLSKNDFEAYSVLRCVGLGLNSYPFTQKETNSYFINNEEALSLFINYPELINSTSKIASLIDFEIVFKEYKLPSYGIKKSKEYLIELCKVGLNKRLKGRNLNFNIYIQRLFYELDVINKMGFSDYFLIVYDYVKFAKMEGILVGPGRGSAPGSLVSYCLGITDIDPIEFGLLFERFLNPERISMPDIDVDFPDDRRDEVIKYIKKRFGVNKVSHITTFGTFGPRLAIRDVARVLRINENRLNFVIKNIPSINPDSLEIIASNNEDIKKLIESDSEIKKLFYIASKFEGLPRHTSTHAAGIIMADRDLVEYTPLSNGINGLFQTQYEASDLELLGLVKMDILGLKNLTIIDNVIKLVEKNTNLKINLNKIDLNDDSVFQMIRVGDTDGVFQLESAGMRKTLMNLKVSSFMDIVHANALYRPGPMEMIPTFIKNKFNGNITYLHNDLKEILEPTYGIIVFQEQIMLIARKFAGYSLGMADILRRAVSKKNVEILEKERVRFVSSAMNKGYTEALSNEVYDYIVKFANYGFNKNHSVAYSLIAYQMSYLKRHFYIYFMAVLMTNAIGSPELIQTYIRDCMKKNVEVLPPSINYSSEEFICYKSSMYFPLSGIVGIGKTLVKQILDERLAGTFNSYEDFVYRTTSFINKKQVALIVYAGGLDEYNLSRKQMIETYDEVREKKGFLSILGNKIIKKAKEYDEYSFDEISLLEKEALGFNLKYNLFIKYEDLRKRQNLLTLNNVKPKTKVKVLFILKRSKEITTKKNELMAFLDIYDDTMTLDAVIFPRNYTNIKPLLVVGDSYIGVGNVDERDGRIQIILENVYSVK